MIYLQMKAYVQLSNDGERRIAQKIIGKKKDKTPFDYPPVPRLWCGESSVFRYPSGPYTSRTIPMGESI